MTDDGRLMMRIVPLDEERRPPFEALFSTYLGALMEEVLPSDVMAGIFERMHRLAAQNVLHIDLLLVADQAAGFVQYQVDSPRSDWCEREGWGTIREVHVVPAHQGKGYGAALVRHAENALRQQGARHMYLTSDGDRAYWERLGYTCTDVLASNQSPLFEKKL